MLDFAAMAEPYLRLRWPVFPVSRDKVPLVEHGYKSASTDPRKIEEWARRFPGCNIAIATGRVSGLTVLDVDGETGERSLLELQAQGIVFPEAPQAVTGRGRHIYMRHDRVMRSSAGKLAPGLDIRADGGSIIAPPSVHQSGRHYVWGHDPEQTILHHFPIAATLLLYNPHVRPSFGGRRLPELRELVARAAAAPQGMRNNELNAVSFLAGRLVREGLSEEQAVRELVQAGVAAGLSTIEAESTVRSGLKAGAEA